MSYSYDYWCVMEESVDIKTFGDTPLYENFNDETIARIDADPHPVKHLANYFDFIVRDLPRRKNEEY